MDNDMVMLPLETFEELIRYKNLVEGIKSFYAEFKGGGKHLPGGFDQMLGIYTERLLDLNCDNKYEEDDL